jgi:DNA-binding response OmpR family regulator
MARILAVDDDRDLLKLVDYQLRRSGHSVAAASTGAQALELVEADGAPDVAILDVAMSGMTGLQLLAELRARPATARLPAIFLSARVSPQDVRIGRGLGALYLTKPYSLQRLLAAIDQCLEGWCPLPESTPAAGKGSAADSGPHVLVVDDDKDLLRLVELQLGRSGFRVAAATSGAVALALIESNGAPDVAILDVAMPGMTGLQLLSELRARTQTSQLPAIFLSARVSTDDIRNGRDLGAIYLTKPYSFKRLLAAIYQCLEGGCPHPVRTGYPNSAGALAD